MFPHAKTSPFPESPNFTSGPCLRKRTECFPFNEPESVCLHKLPWIDQVTKFRIKGVEQ